MMNRIVRAKTASEQCDAFCVEATCLALCVKDNGSAECGECAKPKYCGTGMKIKRLISARNKNFA